MSKKKPLIDADGELRELTREEIRKMRPAKDVLPEDVIRKMRGQRGPQKEPTKVPVSIRLSPEVIERFKAGGRGWQVRLDEALKQWIKEHP